MSGHIDGASALLYAVFFNVAVAVAGFLLFSVLRTRYKWCYQPRLANQHRLAYTPATKHTASAPPFVDDSLLGWVKTGLRLNEELVFGQAGLDAAMMLQFLKLALQFFICAGVIGFFVIIPVNLSAGPKKLEDKDSWWDFDRLSMTNVPPESNHLIAHLLVSMALSVCLYTLLWRTYQNFALLRHRHLVREQQEGRALTVMVQCIDEDKFADSDSFEAHWRSMYPSVEFAALCLYIAPLEAAVRARDSAVHKLCRARVLEKGADTKYWLAKVGEFDAMIAQEQQSSRRHSHVGFVRFKSASDAARAAQVTHSALPLEELTSVPPQARDIVWSHIHIKPTSRKLRGLGVLLAVSLMVVLWTVPVAIVSAMTTLDNLTGVFPFVQPILDFDPTLADLLQGYLPTLVLYMFIMMVPYLLRGLVFLEGPYAHSLMEFSVLKYYFGFQLFNIFFVSVLAGSVFDQLSALIDRPLLIVDVLGVSVPRVSVFFACYIMLRSLSGFPLQLLQLPRLLYGSFNRRQAVTQREKIQAEAPDECEYATYYADHLLIFTIGCTYSVLAPIVLPFVIIYFALAYITLGQQVRPIVGLPNVEAPLSHPPPNPRSQLMYVFVPRFETGGQFWPLVFTRILVALGVAQLTLVGIFGVKRHLILACASLCMVFVTYVFHGLCQNAFTPVFSNLPVETASVFDEWQATKDSSKDYQEEAGREEESNCKAAHRVSEEEEEEKGELPDRADFLRSKWLRRTREYARKNPSIHIQPALLVVPVDVDALLASEARALISRAPD